MPSYKQNLPQLVLIFVLSSLLTNVFGQVQPTRAAGSSSSDTSASSPQPLWSYQVKPSNNYINNPNNPSNGHYSTASSIFDAFTGLSQRQGALSGSPFLSILPIILIAAGGMLLLLPFLTMMIASPFSGGLGGYNNGVFGYPQMGALGKKRSLSDSSPFGGLRSSFDLLEHVSSTIEELTRKYTNPSTGAPLNKRSGKALNLHQATNNETPSSQPASSVDNHRSSSTGEEILANGLSGSTSVNS